jgi:hypothetical protein
VISTKKALKTRTWQKPFLKNVPSNLHWDAYWV